MIASWGCRAARKRGNLDHDRRNQPCRRGNLVQQLAGLQVVLARHFDNFLDARRVRERSILDRLTKLVPIQDHGIRTRVTLVSPQFLPLSEVRKRSLDRFRSSATKSMKLLRVVASPAPGARESEQMDCPHCGKAFHDEWSQVRILTINDAKAPALADGGIARKHSQFVEWKANSTICPACRKPTIGLIRVHHHGGPSALKALDTLGITVYPTSTFRKPTPKEVPAHIREDYEEACKVLPISQKASAALSRRCLQAILQGQGYTQKDLAKQIDALLNEANFAKVIPTALRQTVDVIRNFGNFSAHPVTDQTTLQIIAVQPHEAEWCLDIL